MIPFNKPCCFQVEFDYMRDAIVRGKISGNGYYTDKCQQILERKYGFGKCLLTTSCTDALEMAAILLDINPGDEVIMPSFTFVSTANAFILRGARIVFIDSRPDHPGMDETQLEEAITDKTKAIVVVHYAGVASDMEVIMNMAERYNLWVVEDAAQAIDSYYSKPNKEMRPLGSIGHLAAFSFHETKNVSAGEGGMLVVNDSQFVERAEIIWEKGTNRSAFFKGEVDKYGWVDIGSSFLPSELIASFLFAQLERITEIQNRRLFLWQEYYRLLMEHGMDKIFKLPVLPNYATNNAHMFYLICPSEKFRQNLIIHLKEKGILAVFHYSSLHKSSFYEGKHQGGELPMADKYTERLLRLPFYFDLKEKEVKYIIKEIVAFSEKQT